MKSVGIIAEYNPFHNGHLYHINKVKQMFPDAVIVLVLGGNFTQRGDVSIFDKQEKTKIALLAGVDLVVELPFAFSTGSADIFAKGAIEILQALQVDAIVFGSETNDLEGMQKLVDAQLHCKEFPSIVQVYLRSGCNYPTALSLALKDITGKSYSLPNDLLAISYLKAISDNHYPIQCHSILRINNYHEADSTLSCVSATTIRSRLQQHLDVSYQVPSFVYPFLPIKQPTIDDYFTYCKYKIISEDNLELYVLEDSGIAFKLKQVITTCDTFSQLIEKLKSRNVTYNRLSRMLLYILCGYTKEYQKEFHHITYLRLLGFSALGQRYLNKKKKEITIPIISKFKREKPFMLAFEYRVTMIYALAFEKVKQRTIIEQETKCFPIRKESL